MEQTKQCFTCKQILPLSLFNPDKRKYQIPSDKGTCKVCIPCELEKAIKTMEVIRFDLSAGKFDTIKFNSIHEVINYFNISFD